MAAVNSAKKALWALLKSYNAQRSAKLTVSTEKGKLKVILVENFDKHTDDVLPASKDPRKISPSQLRRKERRAADPAVKERAAAHQAGQIAAAGEETLPSPEKLRSNSSMESLATSPVKDNVREDVGEEVVEEHPQVVVPPDQLVWVPPDFEDRANNDYDYDLEKVDEAVKILGKTDKCCFCDYKCPTPTEQEEKDRESGFGVLDSL